MSDLVLSVAVIAAGVLGWFGVRNLRRPDVRTKGILMIVMALVLVANVVIWTIPLPGATANKTAPTR